MLAPYVDNGNLICRGLVQAVSSIRALMQVLDEGNTKYRDVVEAEPILESVGRHLHGPEREVRNKPSRHTRARQHPRTISASFGARPAFILLLTRRYGGGDSLGQVFGFWQAISATCLRFVVRVLLQCVSCGAMQASMNMRRLICLPTCGARSWCAPACASSPCTRPREVVRTLHTCLTRPHADML